jgi:hypothetical protein
MPQQAINAAQAAITAAQNAKAAQFASAEFSKAQTLLNTAIAEQQKNNTFQAKSTAAQAMTQAEAALRVAQQRQKPATPATPVVSPGTAAKPSTPPPVVAAPGTPKMKNGRKI